jgi:hypothetical protein
MWHYILGSHGNEDSSRGLLGHDTKGKDGGSIILWNVGILPHHYMSQPTRPHPEWF